jgi:predicted membrane chloride channel (bestrophin family)
MTISYSNLVFTSKGIGTFLKLLLKWKGSIYKMVWRELLIYMLMYCGLSLVYRLALDNEGKTRLRSFPHRQVNPQVHTQM